MSSDTNEEWPFPELILNSENGDSDLKIIDFSLGGLKYVLSEYVPMESNEYRSIGVRKLDDVLFVQLSGYKIYQFLIIPHSSEGEEVGYTAKQVFSWYPPFQGDSYSKAYFNTPICI